MPPSKTSTRKAGGPQRALITGLTGQDGSYLAELLLEKGYEVWGLIRRSSTLNTPRIDHLLAAQRQGEERLHLAHGDLSDAASLRRVLMDVHPHEVYNLGAQSHVQISFQIPDYTSDVTALGCLRLLEAIRDLELDARFYQASSSEMYGKAVETPQKETTRFYPRSPYAAAKVFAFDVTRNYREAYGIFAVNGILFNHESPRRGESFVTRKITRAVAAIRAGLKDRLHLGNLEASRDWGFAGDYVDAMWRMLQAEKADDYVVATGETHTVRQFCELAFEQAGMPVRFEGKGLEEKAIAEDGRVLVEVDARHFRPADVDYLLGDATRAREELGWKPKVTFEGLVRMMVDADIEALARSGGRPSEVEA